MAVGSTQGALFSTSSIGSADTGTVCCWVKSAMLGSEKGYLARLLVVSFCPGGGGSRREGPTCSWRLSSTFRGARYLRVPGCPRGCGVPLLWLVPVVLVYGRAVHRPRAHRTPRRKGEPHDLRWRLRRSTPAGRCQQ